MLESSAARYDQTFIFTAVFKLIRFSWCKHDCVLTAVLMIERGNTPVNCTVTRKSQILISYLSDIPHNRHGSLCRHKLLQCHVALLQQRRFPNFSLFSSLFFNDVLHCATRAAVLTRADFFITKRVNVALPSPC